MLFRCRFLERRVMQYSKKPLFMSSLLILFKKTSLKSLFCVFSTKILFNTFMARS